MRNDITKSPSTEPTRTAYNSSWRILELKKNSTYVS